MKISKFIKWFILSFIIVILIISAGYLAMNIYIRINVDKYVSIAQKACPEETDRIYSMIKYITNNDYSLQERNNVVWAIGRLSDKKALPFLQSLYTGEPCNHSLYLCQYELAKAINRCGGSVNYKYKDKKYNR